MEVVDILLEKISNWATEAVAILPNLGIAVILFVAFWLLSKLAARSLCRPLHSITDNQQVINLSQSIARIALVAIGLFTSLRILHLDGAVTSLLAGVGVLGLALGFAFQDIAANFVSGVLMAMRRPFKIGDIIETKDYLGKVSHVDLRATYVEVFSGQIVTIPNKQVYGSPIVNYSSSGHRRVDVEVGISYADNMDKAEKLAFEAVCKLPHLSDREPEVYFKGFGASSIDMNVRMWIDPSQQSFLKTQHEAVKNIKRLFDDNSITIPFPIRTLDFGISGGKSLASELSAAHDTAQPSAEQPASAN
tara:strand:- start:50731 stop:51645 length:915 start_codon:yes stop_codon:yes gene_type:complete